MVRDDISHVVEDYLKTIHDLSVQHGLASTSQIAARLEVTPASVTGMLKKLATTQPPLVKYRKHRGVALSKDGERVALEIIRHHRLIELFLHETLGYSWDEVDAEADRLEHVISEDFEERIAQALGDPEHDPHGDPIPTRELKLPPASKAIPLRDLRPGQRAIVTRVRDGNPDLLRFLSQVCLIPRSHVEVVAYSAFDDNLHLNIEGQEAIVVLGPRITRQIFVDVL